MCIRDSYYIEHAGNNVFLVLSNKNAPNFKILKSISETNRDIQSMETIVEHSSDTFINNILLVDNTLVQEVRFNGLPEIYLLDMVSKETNKIQFSDNAYDVSINNSHSNNESLFYNYSSLLNPESIFKFDINKFCLLYTSPSPRDLSTSRMPSSA